MIGKIQADSRMATLTVVPYSHSQALRTMAICNLQFGIRDSYHSASSSSVWSDPRQIVEHARQNSVDNARRPVACRLTRLLLAQRAHCGLVVDFRDLAKLPA